MPRGRGLGEPGAGLENRVSSWLFTTIELRYSLLGWPAGASGLGDAGTLSALVGFAFGE